MGSQEVVVLRTPAAIQASRLLTSELFFGLVGRVHRSSGGLGDMVHKEHEMTQNDDGSFFLEPNIDESLSGLLKTETERK